MSQKQIVDSTLGRRLFLQRSALLSIGAAITSAVALPNALAGTESSDIALLNVALGLEHQGIAAYQVGAESKLLMPTVLKVALIFQDQHKEHAKLLAKSIKELGGKPVAERASLKAPVAALAKAYAIPLATLKNQADVLHFAASLEIGAAKAYLSTVAKFRDRKLAEAAANIEGDETMHYAILRNVLGEDPVPSAFVSSMPA